ncbi:MAG: arsenite methyltransferase [Acidobacteria bacterium]|nr:arsenite methyltransferase [Acidobacteriota bacterium]MBI3489019.1 arsenite methyltransferase [Acidobacteriota bacterium]
MDSQTIKAAVRKRYAGVVTQNQGCCGPISACGSCAPEETSLQSGYADQDLQAVPEGANLGLGCGNPVALASLKPGETVLDLGSGAGFDAFLASKRVGPEGRVIGVDMTPEMIQRATTLAGKHGYANVEFRLGDIENLPVADAAVDVIISNCVVNLSTDKARVFREAHRVLKPGGRLFVADMVLARPLPEALAQDLDAYGACVAGALLKADYLGAIQAAGFSGVAVLGERVHSLELFSPEFLEAARERNPGLSAEELGLAAEAVLSIQVEGFKEPSGRACGCAPTCCGG